MSKRNRRPDFPQKLRVLVVGGGGREHALVWKLHKSSSVERVYTTHPNNPGIKALAAAVDHDYTTQKAYRLKQFIHREGINLVVVGPEGPLAEGLVDKLEDDGDGGPVTVFGPSAAAAQLESSKGWAKQLMRAASVPTAEGRVFRDAASAYAYLDTREEPPVVKASGLAAGKGVFVPGTIDEARDAVRAIMTDKAFGEAGAEIVMEERLKGPEVSIFAVTDGNNIVLLDPCQDHKRLNEGDTGPNTGGMGAYCPCDLITAQGFSTVQRDIIIATLDALKRERITYRGVLYAGLMLTPAGPKVIEFNVRFGDPECQCLMRRFKGDLGRFLYAAAVGRLDEADIDTNEEAVVCVVLASGGYPGLYETGHEITGLDEAEAMPSVQIFHAGTARKDGKLVTAGGRVLSITATGESIEEARDRAVAAADVIHFNGKVFRRDIAHQVAAVRG